MKFNQDMRMYLPFREGSGIITRDHAKATREIDLVNTPTWTNLASGLPVMALNGINQYMECSAANTVDLDFTGDYSIIGWVNWTDTTASEIIIARYELDDTGVNPCGWELYFYNSILQLRHHHVAGGGDYRTGAYSYNWTPGTPWLFGISRSGAYPLMYRNGVAVEMGYSPGGMLDPDPCARDLVIGTRFTKDSDWFSGWIGNLGAIGVSLTAEDHMNIFQLNNHWFN